MVNKRRLGTACAVVLLLCLVAHALQAQPKSLAIALNDHQTLGERFTAKAPFSSLWVHAPSWSDNEGGFTLTLWDSPQRQKKIASQAFHDYADNARLEITVLPPAPAGVYYWEISDPTGKTRVGLWASPRTDSVRGSQSDEASEDCAYLDGKPNPTLRFHWGVDFTLRYAKKEWPRPEQLIAILNSAAPLSEKSDACRNLAILGGKPRSKSGQIGGPLPQPSYLERGKDAVPVLAGLLSNEKLAHMGRYALEPIPDPAVDDAFRAALGKLKGRLLIGVINSIGVRRDPKAVEPLSKLMQDADPQVASAAAIALGKIGTPEAAKALEQASIGTPALYEGRLYCADALAAQGRRDEAVKIYERLCTAEAPSPIRVAALRGAILARPSGVPLLLEQLHSSDPSMFGVALWLAQHELPGAETTQALAAELGKLAAERQVMLIQALGNRGDPAALPALLAAAKSNEKRIRLAAIRALPKIPDASAIPTLLDALGDSDGEISQAAQDSLGKLPGKEVDAAVVSMIADVEPGRRPLAIELMARRRMKSAIPALLKAAQDTDPQMRLASLKALEELAGPDQMAAMLDLLTGAKTPKEMEAAGRALGAVCAKAENQDACAQKLAGVFSKADPALKRVLLRDLCAVGGGKALQVVRGAVNDPDAEVKAAAIRVLGEWRTMDAARDLLELAKTSPNTTDKLLSLRSFIRLAGNKDAPVDQRLAICKQATALIMRDEERKLLLGMLGGIASLESLSMATPYLDNAATQEEACAAALAVAEKLVREHKVSAADPRLLNPLKKVSQTAANPGLAKRAEALLKQK
jgi:HEAT repeat protein